LADGYYGTDRKVPRSVIADGVPPGGGRPGWARSLLVGAVALTAGGLALFGGYGERDPAPNPQPLPTTTTATTTTTIAPVTPVADTGVVPTGYEIEVFLDGLEIPNDLAFDPSRGLFVSETGANRVSGFEILPDGLAGEPMVVASGIEGAEGLALSDDGVLYVSDSEVVYRVADGVTAPFVDGFADAEGLALDPSGDLFVADDADSGIRISRVEVLSDGTAGTVTEVVVVPGGTAADIDFGPTGELFVANARDAVWVVEVAGDGTVTSSESLATFPERPVALAFDPVGTLSVGTDDSIWMIDPGEDPDLFVSGLDGAEGLAFDASGRLYVTNVATSQILRITPSALGVGLLPVEEVRLEGGGFFDRATTDDDIRQGRGDIVAPETVADGVFFPHFHQWDEGPVWWESGAINERWGDGQPRWLELDPGGIVTIVGAIVQADANDEYLLSYRDLTTGEWQPLWRITERSGGMATRPNQADDTERMVFPEPVTTDLLRFEAWEGDGMYSVSEIQVFASPATAAKIAPSSHPTVAPANGGDASLDVRTVRLRLGARTTLPDSARLDFLNTVCDWGDPSFCYRDAVMVDPLDEQSREGTWEAGVPFHVREGFVNEAEEPLGGGFEAEVYVTRREGPNLDGGIYEIDHTYRFFSDFVQRGTTTECGPGYWTQTEPHTCEWFVHDFPEGLPEGRYDIWVKWFAPCSAWEDLRLVDTCPDPTEVTSRFSSSVNMPFGDY